MEDVILQSNESSLPQPPPVTIPVVSNQPLSQNNMTKKLIFIIGQLVLLILVAFGGYYVGTIQTQNSIKLETEPTTVVSPVSNPISSPKTSELSQAVTKQGWISFTHPTANFSLSYPETKLITCNSGNQGELLLWATPFECADRQGIQYLISVRLVSIPSLAVTHSPSKTEQIMVDGQNVTQRTYTFTEADGHLFEVGSATQVVLSLNTEGDSQVEVTLYGNTLEKMTLFQDVLATFKFNK